jgi:2-polyprenyl-3-methyl-5-hydroxy-6-metoxy-1,4-benzoquinol methylase
MSAALSRDTRVSGDEVVLHHADGEIRIEPLGGKQRRLTVVPREAGAYVHVATCVTSYPNDLIRAILEAKGPEYVCDEIMRDEEPSYLEQHLVATIAAHIDPAMLAGKRVLDFGCGGGASTAILARLLPNTDIVGVELQRKNLAVAEARRHALGLSRVTFLESPAPDRLADVFGTFDAIVLSAVFEHMLPVERRRLMPKLFGALRPGGLLFIDETPFRWFPIENHTTGLPFINYLPDRLALVYARTCSRRVSSSESWETLLRQGIRGGAASEIVRLLEQEGGRARIISPSREGLHDWVALWARGYLRGPGRERVLKSVARAGLQVLHRMTGWSLVPYLSLAIRKDA